MARTLVIGGTLFIGRALVPRLLERGHQVTILHRGDSHPFAGKVEQVRGDRNDVESMKRLLADGDFELVFDNVYDWRRGTKAEQVAAPAEACGPKLRRYVFMSSVAAYGDGLDHDEDDPLAPPNWPDSYCRNKAETERALLRLHQEKGFPAVTLRPPFVYGPHNPFEREQFFWDRILADRPVIIPGDGSRLMQLVFVDDLAEAAVRAAERDAAVGRAYNVAQPSPVTQEELVQALALAAGRDVRLVNILRKTLLGLGGKVFEPPFYFGQYYDLPPITLRIDRARADLGFEPTPFQASLGSAFESYRRQDRPQPDFSFDDRALEAVGSGG